MTFRGGGRKEDVFMFRGLIVLERDLQYATHPMIMGKSWLLNLRFRKERIDMLTTAWIME